jgi:Na+-driven multidrug efflux pump
VISEEYRGAQRWSRDKQAVFAVAWISFLIAAVGTMVFFAFFDPVELGILLDESLEVSRDAGYAAGFFFFWVLCAVCSGVTAFLVRTAPKHKPKRKRQ